MTYECKNCGNQYQGNFCNNCGQSHNIHKINMAFVWHDIQHGLFHFDNGIIYTLWQLFKKPGITIREFIKGKRMRYFPPVSMVVVMATLYGLFYHLFHINTFKYSTNETTDFNELNEWLGSHYSIFTLLTIPFYAFFSYLFFKKQGYNFSEHIVLNSFLASQRLCISLLSLPFLYYATSANQVSAIAFFIFLIDMLLAYRGFYQFFVNISRWKSFLLSTFCYLTTTVVMTIIFAILIFIFNI